MTRLPGGADPADPRVHFFRFHRRRGVPPESNIFLYDEKRFVLVGRTLSINGNVLTITPVLLKKDTTYSVNIPAFSIKDLAGNEMAADKVFYFTTVKK